MHSSRVRKRVMRMSTDILKMTGVTDLVRPQQAQPTTRAQEPRAVLQGREIAADGGLLPPSSVQDQANEAAKVEQAVSQVNEFVQNLNRDLQFTVDEDSGRTVIKVLDAETKEVIRQIPPEELLRIANHLVNVKDSSLLLKVQA